MTLPVNGLIWFIALLPILVLLILMLRFRWGVIEAAPVGVLTAAVTGLGVFRSDIVLIAAESAKGIWNALSIILVVWTSILMYQVGVEVKAFFVIRNGMRKLLPNELLLVVAMGWIFESFLQGITGFGVPVAVGAPLLVGIGVDPLWAVIIPLLGQAWGTTFGTLAAAWDALAITAGIPVGSEEYFLTAFWTALFIFFWNMVTGIAICFFYGKKEAIKKGFFAVMVLSLIQGGGELLLSQINTTLACFIPSAISMLAIFFLGRLGPYRDPWQLVHSPMMNRQSQREEGEKAPEDMNLLQAFFPYILLSVITLFVLLVKPVNSFLRQFSYGPSFPETVSGYGVVNPTVGQYAPMAVFAHAGMFLFLSSLLGMLYYGKKGWLKPRGLGEIFSRATRMALPSSIAVIGLIVMSKIMSGTGQTIVLANGIAGVLGKGYVVCAPFVGFLGTFMTGSNMSSNILFSDFQMKTSLLLEVSSSVVLGAQSSGGAVGSAISPSSIVLGTTTARIPGREGEALKRLLPLTLACVLCIGIFSFLAI